MERTTLTQRARFARALADVLISRSFPGCSKLLRNAYKLLGPAPAGPLRVITRYGFEMVVDPLHNKGVDASVYYNGTYEAGTVSTIMQSLRPGDVFIDAGANIGLMSLAAAQVVGPAGHVHAFEPVPDVIKLFKQNVALNGTRNVTLHAQALGSACERRTIYEQPGINKGSASLVRPVSGHNVLHEIEVVTLDSCIATTAIPSVRMVKADVEGWELDLLRGAEKLLSQNNAPILCVEYSKSYSPRKEELLDMFDFIRSINRYEFYKLKHGKETISPLVQIHRHEDLPQHDNLFCFLASHRLEIGSKLFNHR